MMSDPSPHSFYIAGAYLLAGTSLGLLLLLTLHDLRELKHKLDELDT